MNVTVQLPTHLVKYLETARRNLADPTYNAAIQAALESAAAKPDLPVPASTQKRLTVRFDPELLSKASLNGLSKPDLIRWAVWTQMFGNSIEEIESILAKHLSQEEVNRALEQIIPVVTNLAGHVSPEEKMEST